MVVRKTSKTEILQRRGKYVSCLFDAGELPLALGNKVVDDKTFTRNLCAHPAVFAVIHVTFSLS